MDEMNGRNSLQIAFEQLQETLLDLSTALRVIVNERAAARIDAERPFGLEDYRPFLRSLVESEDESALVGGLAVAAWAEMFLDDSDMQRFDLPIFSKHRNTSL